MPVFLHDFFDASLRRWPERVALDIPPGRGRAARARLTYAELHDRASALAAAIQPICREEVVVAIMLPRTTPQAFIAQLGVLRAGAAYVAIDPAFPDARVRELLTDAAPVLLLTDAAGRGRARRLGFEHVAEVSPDGRTTFPTPAVPADQHTLVADGRRLAYLIYTSGTTGRPKAVMLEHGAIVNLIAGDIPEFGLSPDDRVGQGSSHAYDSSVEETWLAWSSGAAVVVIDDDVLRAGPDLTPWIEAEGLTVLCPTPTLLRAMGVEASRRLGRVRLIYAGGESLPRDVADAWAAGRRFVNGYGPTECAVTSVRADVLPGEAITIGHPVPGVDAYVLDDELHEVAPGESGELCLGGAGLARGYLGASGLTAARFPQHPTLGRLYRTGDLVRRTADGSLVTLGRLDSQVKVRGYRLELEEVEARLVQCPGVRAAACRVETSAGRQDLVAFVVPADPAAPPQVESLRAALALALPLHAVPRVIALINALPVTIGGKLNRAALPALDPESDGPVARAPTPGASLGQLAALIEAPLRRLVGATGPVSVDADFFLDLGGDSLRAAEFVTALRAEGRTSSITVRDVYEGRTIRNLTAVAQSGATPVDSGGAAVESGPPDVSRLTSRGRPFAATAVQMLCILLESILGGVLLWWLIFDVVHRTVDTIGLVPMVLATPLLAIFALTIYGVTTLSLAVAAKRLLIGRDVPRREPVWGDYYVRLWVVQQIVRAFPWALLAGTELQLVALRALGARIGRRVHVHRGVNLLQGGWDLLEIGDDVTLRQDAALQLVDLEDGEVIVSPVRLERGATVDVRATVSGFASIGANGYLAAHGWLRPHTSIPTGQRWSGIPATPAGPSPDAPSIAGGVLAPWAYGLAGVTAVLVLGLVLALPSQLGTILVARAAGITTPDISAWLASPDWRALGPWPYVLALILMPVTAGWTAVVIRALGRATPGVIPRWSWAYLRVWLKTGLLEGVGDWLSGTLFWPVWLRAAGMRVGRGCEISTIIDVVPELVEIGDLSFFADGIYLAGPEIHRGAVRLERTTLGADTFVGNHAVIPTGFTGGTGVLIGISTVAGPETSRAGTSWFGNPPFELSRRADTRWDPACTLRPSPIRFLNRVGWETLRASIPLAGLAGAVAWTDAIAAASDLPALQRLSVAGISSVAVGGAICLGVLILKWLLLGRVRPGEHPLWSCWCSRWDFLYVVWAHLARPLLARLEGTLLLSWYLRATGARIGRRVVLGGGFAQMVDPDMLTIEDNATVHALFQAHTFEDRVLKIDRVRIGRRSTVGHGAVVLAGAEVGDDASVSPNSVVMKHERLNTATRYMGCPVMASGTRRAGAVLTTLVCLVIGGSAWAQTPRPLPRLAHAPTLDDVAADRWPNEGRLTDFRQREPGDLIPASDPTVGYVGYDATHLYVAFRCQVAAGRVRARLSRREDIADDDQVAVYLDTFRSRQRAYMFSTNPLGVQYDAVLNEGDDPDETFDAVWNADARLTPEGYVVLMTVPFRSLRFSGDATQTWGLSLGRVSPVRGEQSFWPAITNRIEGFTNQMAAVSIEGVVSPPAIDLIPYGAALTSRYLDEAEPAHVIARDARGGFDLKAVVHDGVTLDVTVNPDFSQIESDEPQVTINRRFEVVFPERRPFFLENTDVFSTPDQLFYSRRVLDPSAGARLTGKLGRWTFGGLVIGDAALDPESDEGSAGTTTVSVARLQREFGAQSRVGLLATSRQGPAGSNTVVAADARLKLSPTWVFTGQAARSDTSGADAGNGSGTDVYGEIARSGRALSYSLSYLDRSPLFDPRLGYVDRVDIRQVEQDASYQWFPKQGRVRSLGPVLTSWADWDHRGIRQDWYVEPGLSVSFNGPIDLHVARVEREEVFQGVAFRQHLTRVEGRDAHIKTLTVGGSLSVGTSVNYEPPAGTRPDSADTLEASATLSWRPRPRFRVDETWYYTRLATPPRGVSAGVLIFDNTLARTTARFQFTQRFSTRLILDYEGVHPTPGLASHTLTRRLTADLLFTYLVDPFTAVYAGYSDRLENLALRPGSPARLDTLDRLMTSTGRQLFVKISYGIRF